MLTLAESAKLSQDTLRRGVLETFVIESPVLDRIPFLPIEGNSYSYNEEATLPGVEFRAVNSPYAESTGTVNPKSERLVILGGDADVDTFIAKTRSNINDQRALQTRGKVKAAAFKFQDSFINGDITVDANGFDGLKRRLTGGQVIPLAANGAPVIGNGNPDSHGFLDALDALIAAVPGCEALYMNSVIRQKILSSLRRLNVSVTPVGTKQQPAYRDIPLIDIGNRADGSAIIPQTETQGTVTDASSIYAVKFGRDETEQAVTGLTNGGVQVEDLGKLQSKPAYRTRIEFFCGLAVFGGKAGARLAGVRNA